MNIGVNRRTVLEQRRRVPQSLKKEAAVRMSLRWVNLINSPSLISLTRCTIVKQLVCCRS